MIGQDAYTKQFKCSYCEESTEINVPYGCFLRIDKDPSGRIVMAEILEERPGIEDKVFIEIKCRRCGCVGGWSEITPNSHN